VKRAMSRMTIRHAIATAHMQRSLVQQFPRATIRCHIRAFCLMSWRSETRQPVGGWRSDPQQQGVPTAVNVTCVHGLLTFDVSCQSTTRCLFASALNHKTSYEIRQIGWNASMRLNNAKLQHHLQLFFLLKSSKCYIWYVCIAKNITSAFSICPKIVIFRF